MKTASHRLGGAIALIMALPVVFVFAASTRVMAGDTIDSYIEEAGRTYGINPNLIRAIGRHESGFDQSKIGLSGEVGIMQILPATARSFGWDLGRLRKEARYNIHCGAEYLSEMARRIEGKWRNADQDRKLTVLIASYNAGWEKASSGMIPGSTRNYYIPAVKSLFYRYGDGHIMSGKPPKIVTPSISGIEVVAEKGLPVVGEKLVIRIGVRNEGEERAERGSIIVSFRRADWSISRGGLATKLRVKEEGDYYVLERTELGIAPGDSFAFEVEGTPKKTSTFVKVRCALEAGGRTISYPHVTEPEWLDPRGFPAIRVPIAVERR